MSLLSKHPVCHPPSHSPRAVEIQTYHSDELASYSARLLSADSALPTHYEATEINKLNRRVQQIHNAKAIKINQLLKLTPESPANLVPMRTVYTLHTITREGD